MEEKLLFKSGRRNYLLPVFLVVSLSLALLSFNFKYLNFAVSADEGYYFKYAQYIIANGLGGFVNLFKLYLVNHNLWVFPNPLRIGFVLLSALWLKIFGISFINLAFFSLFCYCIFLFVNFYFANKYFGAKSAILLLILLAFSPLNLAMARRCLVESCLVLFTSLTIWLFWKTLQKRRWQNFLLFACLYSITILVKETSFLLLGFFAAYHLWQKAFLKKNFGLPEIFWVYILPCAIVALVYTALGVMPYILPITRIIIISPQTNSYALLFGSGPWFRYIIDYLLLSPLVTLLAVTFIIGCLIDKEKEEVLIKYFLFFFWFNFLVFNFFTKNIRYVMILDLPLRIFALLMLQKLTGRWFKDSAALVIVIAIILVGFFDLMRFTNFFLVHDIYDPISFFLLKAEHIIPFN